MMLKEQCKEMRELYEDLLRGNSNLRREIRSLAHSKDDASSKLLELEEVGRLKIKELQALKNHFRMLQKEECILANHLEDLTGTLPHLSPEHMIQCQLEISQEASSLLQATNKKMLQQTTDKPQAEKSREERQVKGKEKMHLEEKMIRVVPPTLAKTQRKVEIAGTTTMKSRVQPARKSAVRMEEEKTKKLKDILSGDESNFKICNFQEKGRGVVTLKSFKRGDLILQYKGDLLKYREGKQTEETYSSDDSIGCYMLFFK
ncbi:hypothetical protein XELAEV_18000344mg, partial [Xenopus laevis]